MELKGNRRKFIIFALFVIGAVLILFLFLRQDRLDYSTDEESLSVQPQQQEVAPEKPKGPTNKSGIEIPEKVYTYQGEITDKKEDGFVLKVSAIDNAVEEDQVMDIRVDTNTRFVRLVITTPKAEVEKTQTRTEGITLADLEVGARVTITTRENVLGRTAFLAESVRAVVEE